MDPHIKVWHTKFYPPFALFQAEDGRWGIVDANGNVYEKPVYNRLENRDRPLFDDGESGLFSFDETLGMQPCCWGEPWWAITWEKADFPEEYNEYIWYYIHHPEEDTTEALRHELSLIPDNIRLSDRQRHIIDGLYMMLRWEKEEDDDKADRMEEEWMSQFPVDENAQPRVDALIELMSVESIPLSCRRALWFANFKFIDLFCNY